MSTAIDDKLRTFIGDRQHEAVHEVPAGSGRSHKRTTAQPPPPVRKYPTARPRPVSSRPPHQRRGMPYGWVAVALVVLLLLATGIAYYQHQKERAAVASRIDAILGTPLADPLETRFSALEKKLVADSHANKIRLQAFEQRLIENQQAYRQQLLDMEQRLVQLHAPQAQRLQPVELHPASPLPADVEQVPVIEQPPAPVMNRMDSLAAGVENLPGNAQPVSPLPAATTTEPPGKHALEPVSVAHNTAVRQTPMTAADATPDRTPLAAPVVTAHAARGDWVINIGSYMRETIAARKLAEFRKQGVNAEQETSTVRGKTVYRVQVPGFVTMAEAREQARQVQGTLGLKETWVRRR